MDYVCGDDPVKLLCFSFDRADDIQREELSILRPEHEADVFKLVAIDYEALGSRHYPFAGDRAVFAKLRNPYGLHLGIVG